MKKLAIWLLYSVAVILPFAYSDYYLTPFVSGKVIFLRWMVFLLSAVTLGIFVQGKEDATALLSRVKEIWSGTISRILIASIGFLGISTVLAFDRTVAFFGEMQRAEGFLTLATLFVFYIFYRLYFSKKEWQTFFVCSTVASIGIFFVALYQEVIVGTRATAFTGNPTFLAGYLIFSLFAGMMVYAQGKTDRKKEIAILGSSGVVTALIGMFFSENRATLFGIILTCIVLSIIILLRKNKDATAKKYTKPAYFFLGVLIVGTILVGSTRTAPVWQHVPGVARIVTTTSSDSTLLSRALFSQESLTHFWTDGGPKRILFGWGWDNYVFFWTKHYNPKVFYYDSAVADRSHNKFVDMLVMTGVVGFGLYISLWIILARHTLHLLKEQFARALPYLLYLGVYFVFLFAAFDLIQTLIGFYAVLAYTEYEKLSA